MAFVPTPNTARVTLNWLFSAEQYANVLWFLTTSDPTPVELEALGIAVNLWVQEALLPLVGSQVQYAGCTVVGQSDDTSPIVPVPLSPPSSGEITTSDVLPGNVTWTVTFATFARGRSSRGRFYVVGLTEAETTGNYIMPDTADSYIAAFEGLNDALPASPAWQHVVVSFQNNGVKRTTGFAQPVTVYRYADLALDSQRRRLAGRGD